MKNKIKNKQNNKEEKDIDNLDEKIDLNKSINKYQVRIDEIDIFLKNINTFEGTVYNDFL